MQQQKLPRQYSFLLLYNLWWSNSNCGGFCLHLLVFPFVYQFKSRIGVLVHSSFANDENYNNFSASFQILFVVVFTWKRMQLLHLSLFPVLKWDEFLLVQLPFELQVQIPVQLLLEQEPNWIVQYVIELEFEQSRIFLMSSLLKKCLHGIFQMSNNGVIIQKKFWREIKEMKRRRIFHR